MSINLKQCMIALLLLATSYTASAQTVFVNRAATGANNGTSWANAYTSLSAAMRATTTAGRQIWVAAGTYVPDTTAGFLMSPGVQLYGGFAGTEATLGQRNVTANATILSGDRQGNDTPGNFTANKTDNLARILVISGADTISRGVINGFTFRGAHNLTPTPPATPTPTAAQTLAARGGAILTLNRVTIQNCIFTDNRATTGSCIVANGVGSSNTIVRDCRFERNLTPERALVYFVTMRNGEFRRSTFQNNNTARGCFMADGSRNILVDSCVVDRNITNSNNSCAGVYMLGTTGNITNTSFTANRSVSFAGAVWVNGGNVANLLVRVANCTFERDTCAVGGGAVLGSSAARVTFSRCSFTRNYAGNSAGGVNIQSAGSVAFLEDCTFTENKVGGGANAFGGGFSCSGYAESTLTNCTFSKNDVGGNDFSVGGAIYMQNDTTRLTLNNCTFNENSVSSGMRFQSGGAIYQNVGPDLVVNNSTFTGNSADFGAAIYATGRTADKSTLIVNRSKFTGNAAATQGGALNLEGALATTLTNSLFAQNLGSNGGAISTNATNNVDTTLTTITYCTFAENVGDRPCIVQYEPKDSTRAQAIMFLQNNAFGPHTGRIYEIEEGTPIVISRGGNVVADGSLSTVLTGTRDRNNTVPTFVNPAVGNYRPAAGSPALNNAVPVAGITVDLDGNVRDNTPDSGSYEGSTVGTFSAVQALRLDLSPNPTPHQVRVQINDESNGVAVVEFFDATGKLVLSQRTEKPAGEWQLTQSVAAWPAGLYQVRVRVGSTLYAGALVKE